MSFVTDAFSRAREIKKELPKSHEDRHDFFWDIIMQELNKQPDDNLVSIRKAINKILVDRRRNNNG